jgi:hypothetical protein
MYIICFSIKKSLRFTHRCAHVFHAIHRRDSYFGLHILTVVTVASSQLRCDAV